MLRIMNSSFNCVPVLYINNATILIWVTLPERSDGPGLVVYLITSF
jgi:hypothetical protein